MTRRSNTIFLAYDKHKRFLTLTDRAVKRRFTIITRAIENPTAQGLACYNWIKDNIAYLTESRREDEWQLPSETISRKSGDCEDHALLLTTFLLKARLNAFFCRGYELGRTQFHAFVVVINAPRTGLNYWDTTTDKNPNLPPFIIFEAINQKGITHPLGMLNFAPTILPLLKN